MSLTIIGGRFKQRKLFAPNPSAGTRPTSSKLREAIFNICQEDVQDAAILDLFAVSCALGFEAISRGASSALFIDSNKEAVRVIEKNRQLLHVESQTSVLLGKAHHFLLQLEKSFDLIFIDPPYHLSTFHEGCKMLLSELALLLLDRSRLLRAHGSIFVECCAKNPPKVELSTLALIKEKTFGDSLLQKYETRCEK